MTTEDDGPIEVESAAELTAVRADNRRVVVEFYTQMCGPCVTVEIFLEEITAGTDVVVAQVDVEALPALADEYGITTSPSVVSFVGGDPDETVAGMRDREVYADLVDGTTGRGR